MKKHERTDKRIRADKYRRFRRHLIRRLGQHDRWSDPERMARSRAYVSATARNLELVLANDDVFEEHCKQLGRAILAGKRTR